MGQIDHPIECPGCGANEVSTKADLSSSVCDQCGLVYDGSEWPTEIAEKSETQEGDDPKSNNQSNWQDEIAVADASDQQLVRILSIFDSAANSLDICDDARARAADIVTQAWSQNITHGRRVESIVAATIYLTCRETGKPRPSHVIAEVTQADEQQVHDIARVLSHQLELDIATTGACGYIPYLVDELEFSEPTATKASQKLTNMDSVGGEPAAIAAAALYVVSRNGADSVTLTEAGDAAGVTKETVWRHTTHIS